MTREELDARAAELGISTSSRWKDDTVAEKIAEAEAALAAKNTTPGAATEGSGPVQGAAEEQAAPTQTLTGGEVAAQEDGAAGPGVGKAESALPAVPKPEQPPEGVLTVIGPKKGRWRAGRHFTPEPVEIPLANLTEDEIAMLAADPKLTLSGLPQD